MFMRTVTSDTRLVLVKQWSVMEEGVREYSVDTPTHRAQLGHRRLLDAHSTTNRRTHRHQRHLSGQLTCHGFIALLQMLHYQRRCLWH